VIPFLVGATVGAVVVFALGYPLVAPWRTRLHWLLASQVPDPVLGMVPWSRLVMREVTVADVRVTDDGVEATLADGPTRREVVTRTRRTASVVQLKRWYAMGLPLLLLVDDGGDAQLCGPDGNVTGFQERRARV